ncbi:MAG: aminotransferase class I/II-fold pyridoxal phosphate-dependent enzyme [Anaerolineae bacterium]|nr:aminotransferase class I/II-fold pyridoxal phosphate-dependent enzyme [Anaerolineae bacterium]
MIQPAERLEKLPPYVFAVAAQRIRKMTTDGIDVIRLDIGSPDKPPPDTVINQLIESVHNPKIHGYSGYQGTPAFRKAIAQYYQKRFGVTVEPEREVLPLLGSKEGIINLCLAYLNPGDLVLVPDIGYPSYSMGARLTGAEIYWLPLTRENGFVADLSQVPEAIADRAKFLWVNYPNNPTGVVISNQQYDQIMRFCAQHDILLVSDNPYVEVTFDGCVAGSALQSPDALNHAVEFVSFSKTYNMAGWRLGAAVGNREVIQKLLQIKSNVDSGHFLAIYEAGITAIEDTTESWEHERNHIYQQRRDRVLEALPQIGLDADVPKGSLYIWAYVENGSGLDYAEAALEHAHVALAPGSAYGPGGERYIRISVSVPDDRLDAALNRLKEWYPRSQFA